MIKHLCLRGTALLFCICTFFVAASLPAQSKEVKAYIFGNSLVHHVTDSDETTVPHWLDVLAKSAGHSFAVDGQWGFLRNFSQDLPPLAGWSFQGVSGVWNPDGGHFGRAGFNTVMINPANFIQAFAADEASEWENPTGRTPLEDTLVVFDWIVDQGATPRFFLYEGWEEMPGLIEAGAAPSAFADYYTNAQHGYHKWYVDWAAGVMKARPQYDVSLIPVAKILAQLFTETPLSKIAPADLYSDDAPHGTATLYFLAAAITYSAYFDEPIPTDINLPDSIHPLVRENLVLINQVIAGKSVSNEAAETIEPTVHANLSPAQGVKNPSLAMGLNGIADWSTQNPFIDVMKSGRPWIGHLHGQWGGWEAEDLARGNYLDAAGWPKIIPEQLSAIETLILTDRPTDSTSISGVYRLTYEGEGDIAVIGRAKRLRSNEGEIWFRYQPGEGPVGIAISDTDPNSTGNYIRNIHVVQEKHIELFETGALFNPDWLKLITDLRSVRFMDWMNTNGSDVSSWEDRPVVSDYTYIRRGVPVEVMVRLANRIKADPWFNMPHMADDIYFRNFADYVHENLDPLLHTYIEYSNELWNFTFSQTHWAAAQAVERWGEKAAPDAWLQFAGVRAAQMAQIWSEVYGADAEQRLIRVIATHTGWEGLEEGLLGAPLYLAENSQNLPPVTWFDAYAVTGYFGLELGTDEIAPKVLEWISQSQAVAEVAGKAQGLARISLQLYVDEHGYETVVPLAIDVIRKGSLAEYLTQSLPYQAALAKSHGLQLVMYEGGTHVAGLAGWSGNDDLTRFFNHLNYSPEMAGIYSELLSGWRDAGGTLFNAFVDVSAPSQYGSWGSLRHLNDTNPRNDVLTEFNVNTPAWWKTRADNTFVHGATFEGTGGADTLRGTDKGDIMMGLAGDDTFYAQGKSELINGGVGTDTVVLAGQLAEYSIRTDGEMLHFKNAATSVQMINVETIVFSADPDTAIPTNSF